MKKYISFLLAIIICIGLFSFSAFAADEKIVVKTVPSTSTLAIGETFTVDFELTTNAGFYTLGLEVDYDQNVLEVVCPNHKEGSNCTGSRSPVTNKIKSSVANNATDSRYHTVTPYKIMWAFGTAEEDFIHLGHIATLTFKVKSMPTSNKTTIALVVDQSSSIENGKYSKAERVGVGATVTVTCPAHNYSDWKLVKESTYTEKGSESRTCSICNKTETRDIAMKEHTFSSWATSKAPTCEASGEEFRSCTTCGFKETKILEKLDHSFKKPVVTKKPTCTETGLEIGECTRCNKQTENILKATGHNISNYTIYESTCTREGKKQGICTVCGLKSEEKLPLKEHTFGEPVVTKEATKTETGLKTSICTVCGEIKKEIIPSKSETSKPAVESSASSNLLTESASTTSTPTSESALENSSEKSEFTLSDTEKIPGKTTQTGEIVAIILLSLSAVSLIASTVIVVFKKR